MHPLLTYPAKDIHRWGGGEGDVVCMSMCACLCEGIVCMCGMYLYVCQVCGVWGACERMYCGVCTCMCVVCDMCVRACMCMGVGCVCVWCVVCVHVWCMPTCV
jgi:hypothetical protein